jgi:hypothetical protein
MRPSLQSVLDSVRELQPEELPALLGELEIIRATALMRITQPAPVVQADELLDINQASQRLGTSVDYLYRHAESLPFTRRIGRKLLFSSRGVESYINRKR